MFLVPNNWSYLKYTVDESDSEISTSEEEPRKSILCTVKCLKQTRHSSVTVHNSTGLIETESVQLSVL